MGYKTCTKGVATKLSNNFNSTEFDCHGSGCCSQTLINETLVWYLQKIRDHFGKPIIVTSGYRCATHNKNVSRATGSRHTKGDAADIVVSGITPREVAKYAESIGIKGIGLYETDDDGHFVHIDTRSTKAFWYGQAQAYRSTFKDTNNLSIKECNTMKYSTNNKPLVCMMTNSTCYNGTTKFTPKGILWHSTGANNPWIKRYVQPSKSDPNYSQLMALIGKNLYGNDWNSVNRGAGLNAWIGKLEDGTVAAVQTMPWDYKPWGCGSGYRGSCNSTHIQFEICEDALNDRVYFEKAYKEACELTAYLCKLYNIDPKGSFSYNGVTVPTILCHKDSARLGLGSDHIDIEHWFPKFGKTMNDVRNDVAALMGTISTPAPDPAPQTPPTSNTTTSIAVGDEVKLVAGAKYASGASIPSWVFGKVLYVRYIASNGNITISTQKTGDVTGVVKMDALTKNGQAVSNTPAPTPTPTPTPNPVPSTGTLRVGDTVKLVSGAKYTSGQSIPNWVINSALYVRELRANGDVVFSTLKTGAITGVVSRNYIVGATQSSPNTSEFPYQVKVMIDTLNIRSGPGSNYKLNGTITNHGVYTIVEASNGYGKLKSGAGWIYLDYTQRV